MLPRLQTPLHVRRSICGKIHLQVLGFAGSRRSPCGRYPERHLLHWRPGGHCDRPSPRPTGEGTMTTTNKISISGLVSGYDTDSLVTAMTAMMKLGVSEAQDQQKVTDARLTGYKSLETTLTALKTSTDRLSKSDNWKLHSATVSDTSVMTATATAGASPGTYQLQVTSLAQAQQKISQGFSGTDAVLRHRHRQHPAWARPRSPPSRWTRPTTPCKAFPTPSMRPTSRSRPASSTTARRRTHTTCCSPPPRPEPVAPSASPRT